MKPVLFIVLHLGTVKDWQWSDTSVNLPKWASSQIYATAPALNNSVHCTSVLFHFYLFSPCQLSGAQIIATVSTGNAFFFFHIEPSSLGPALWKSVITTKRSNKKNGNIYSIQPLSRHPHGDIKVMHFTVIALPVCAYVPQLWPYWVSQAIKVIIFFCGTVHCPP